MRFKIKVLVGILIIGIVLVGGWWIWSSLSKIEGPILVSELQLILKSDKEVYEAEEPIKTEITVSNGGDKSIHYTEIVSSNFDCKSITYIIKSGEEIVWKLDGITEMQLVNTVPTCREIEPKNTKIFSKNLLQQKLIPPHEVKILEPGMYSISATLYFSYQGVDNTWDCGDLTESITSNTTTIKIK